MNWLKHQLLYSSLTLLSITGNCYAVNAISFTLDNDLFIGSDDGYTNGVYASWYYFGRNEQQPDSSWLVWPLKWSMPEKKSELSLSAYTIGQSMFTPEDITTPNPDPDDTPYAGLLFINNTYLVSYGTYADNISTIIGIIGPASGAEKMQEWVHSITDSEEPMGWDHQLENEIIFKFTRGRTWRSWVSENRHFDVISLAEIGVGTLESSINAGVTLRAGNQLSVSHLSAGLMPSRSSNFIAVNDGWFVYATFGAQLIANQIVFNGNTFRDSPSAELDKTQLAFTTGLAYSWDNLSITLAYADLAFTDDKTANASRFGTLTIGWFFR